VAKTQYLSSGFIKKLAKDPGVAVEKKMKKIF